MISVVLSRNGGYQSLRGDMQVVVFLRVALCSLPSSNRGHSPNSVGVVCLRKASYGAGIGGVSFAQHAHGQVVFPVRHIMDRGEMPVPTGY